MTNGPGFAAMAALVLLIPSSATAQSRPPAGTTTADSGQASGSTTFRPDRDTRQSFYAYNQMLDYGKCTSGIGKDLVDRALDQQPMSAAEQAQYLQIDTRLKSCARAGLSNIHSLRRGSFAEGLYHKMKVDAATLPQLVKSSPDYTTFAQGEVAYNKLRDQSDQPFIAATNCMASERPALADAVLRTKHGSDAEASAMDALFAGAPDCAGAVRPSNISRSFIRAFLADSLRRYARFSTKTTG